MYKNHPLNLDVTDIFELVTKVPRNATIMYHMKLQSSSSARLSLSTAHPLIFFLLLTWMFRPCSLHEPRLISWILWNLWNSNWWYLKSKPRTWPVELHLLCFYPLIFKIVSGGMTFKSPCANNPFNTRKVEQQSW